MLDINTIYLLLIAFIIIVYSILVSVIKVLVAEVKKNAKK